MLVRGATILCLQIIFVVLLFVGVHSFHFLVPALNISCVVDCRLCFVQIFNIVVLLKALVIVIVVICVVTLLCCYIYKTTSVVLIVFALQIVFVLLNVIGFVFCLRCNCLCAVN